MSISTVHCPRCGHHIADLQPNTRSNDASKARADARTELRDFLAARTVHRPNSRETSSDLYLAYVDWCDEQGIRRGSRQMFGRALNDIPEITKARSNGIRYCLGVKLM